MIDLKREVEVRDCLATTSGLHNARNLSDTVVLYAMENIEAQTRSIVTESSKRGSLQGHYIFASPRTTFLHPPNSRARKCA